MKKDYIREKVWKELIKYAKPDSRFHFNFAEFIPDFEGSEKCVEKIRMLDIYKNAKLIFITPDNCLERLREVCLRDNKPFIMPTYGIRRGFVYLSRELVPLGMEEYASTLDGAEKFGKYVSLADIMKLGKIDFLVTGASVVDVNGVRYGKGHGYFDLEWAMLREIGVVDDNTPIIAIVHDCQVIDENIEASSYDTIVDYIITPTRIIKVKRKMNKPQGIDWKKLPKEMLDEIPPLQELKDKLKVRC